MLHVSLVKEASHMHAASSNPRYKNVRIRLLPSCLAWQQGWRVEAKIDAWQYERRLFAARVPRTVLQTWDKKLVNAQSTRL